MPSKSAMFFWVSLFFIVQFAPIPVAAVDAASSFQTQTLPANSPPTSSLGPIVKRDDNKDIKDQHGWMFNNCDPTDQDVGIVSKGRRIVPAVIGNVQAGQEHLKKLLQKNPKNTPDNQKWVVGAKDNNCGLVTCVKDTVIHFCNYNSETSIGFKDWEPIIYGVERVLGDSECARKGGKVCGEAVFNKGWTVVVSGDKC